jgi:peptidoglycan/LPS O-acetylase OafA/YrhL
MSDDEHVAPGVGAWRLIRDARNMQTARLENGSTRVKPRLVGLDLLRLLAILMVLGRHLWPSPPRLPLGLASFFRTWECGGWVGVDLFFVLSGFLVSGLLFTEYKSRGRLSVGRFYTRRGWKIYPPLFALVAFTVLINSIHGQRTARWPLFSDLTFLQSYSYGLWGHTWSLAVEEHFYLILPLTLLLLLKLNSHSSRPFQPTLGVAACVGAACLILRLFNWHLRHSYSFFTHIAPSHLRFDSLFFGVAISYAYHFHTTEFVERLTPWRRGLIAGGVLLLSPAFIFPVDTTSWMFTVGLTVFYIGSGMLLVGTLLCNIPQSRIVVFLATIGAYSYSIYLWHLPVISWGIPRLEMVLGRQLGFGARVGAYLLGSLGVGIITAKIVEFPALRLRDYWFPPRSKGPIEEVSKQTLPLEYAQSVVGS